MWILVTSAMHRGMGFRGRYLEGQGSCYSQGNKVSVHVHYMHI